jgi:hypothetical protein
VKKEVKNSLCPPHKLYQRSEVMRALPRIERNMIRTWLFRLAVVLSLFIALQATTSYATNSGAWARASAFADRINVAASENGGSASASSTNDGYFPGAIIDGDRSGLNLTSGGGWRDGTPGVFPDWVEIAFSGPMNIDEIDVFTQQDGWWNPQEPTETLLFFNNGITAFDVQYWNGSNWVTVPNGSVIGNNKVWRRFSFTQVTTSKIRVVVNAARAPYSTIVEVEAWGSMAPPPDPSPTPTPSPTPGGNVESALAAREIFFDDVNNVGFGTQTPIFNDDGTTGANVGNWVAIDGKTVGAAAYLGIGGTVPQVGDRVGVLSFYNWAMGGVDHRTAAIFSFNGAQLGTGNLEFYTTPNFIGPVRRMQIAPTGEVGINHAAGTGTMVSIMGKTADASTKSLVVLDGIDRAIMTVRSDGQISADRPGQGIVLKSPNGLVCRKLTIDDSGALIVMPMGTCP